MKKTICIGLILILCMGLAACNPQQAETDLWETALYTKDTELGTGEKTLFIEVEAVEKTVLFTIHTDKETVGEALEEHRLVTGEQGPYGLYIKAVNGIIADYDIDQSYWAFYKEGEYMTAGVDKTEFDDQDRYELIYTK